MSATSIHAMLAMQAKNYKIYEPLAEDLLMKRFQNEHEKQHQKLS